MPVNRYFTAENPEPQPDLECVVGVHSAAASEMYRVKCTDAWNISVKYDRKKANSLAADRHISEHDRRLRTIRLAAASFLTTLATILCRFGIQGSGIKYNAHAYWKNWTGPISNWVCGYTPMLGMIVLDCIPEVSAT